uniref:DDE Tnp4 domain-containing protein n=1 Tax=Magallana gigas TaxID=29159 RepID=A0A8W8N1K4_MAGGI
MWNSWHNWSPGWNPYPTLFSTKRERDYFNRKQFPSIQLQVVCDSDMVIRHAYTGWPGCTHDARVLRNSSLFEDGEQGNAIGQRNFIIADSAYPLRNWLITPLRNTGHHTPKQHSHDDVEDFIDEDHDVNANFYPNIYQDGGCGAARRNEIMNALL